MKSLIQKAAFVFMSILMFSCASPEKKKEISAKDILGNPEYLAMSYGGYRQNTRDIQPTIAELKEDMKILSAMGIKILRTYNVHLEEASNLLKAISELKQEDANFEMYVMLGAWIDCKNAFTELEPIHNEESERNAKEIATAVELAKKYPDIVKIIAVGNEAMVHWATSYYVEPFIILKWVNHLQELKQKGELSKDLWITSSDNFASWGGGDDSYHTEDLTKLLNAVDFVSLHTYPFHSSHYDAEYWKVPESEENLTTIEKADAAMLRAKNYAVAEYEAAAKYIKSVGVSKPIHIGETGWATESGTTFYGANGSGATDEYKSKLFYDYMRAWTNEAGMSCFYFEIFDESWKDAQNPLGSENHFGLITIDGKAKFALWDLVDAGAFKGLTRNGNEITKTYNGDKDAMLKNVLEIPLKKSVEE